MAKVKSGNGRRRRIIQELTQFIYLWFQGIPFFVFRKKKKSHEKFALYNFKQIFLTLDLASKYWQNPIYPRDTEKLFLDTTFGLFEWLYLPFRLKNAPRIFHHTTKRLLNKYKIDSACNYFDDIIFSKTDKEHMSHLCMKFAEDKIQFCKRKN